MDKMKRDRFGRPAILLLILALNSLPKAHGQSAREILERTGVKGGLIVHCRLRRWPADGRLAGQ